MYCINPIYIEGRGVFPCGLCRFCRVMRQNQWAMRMMHEKKYWDKSSFVTLTYNNDNLPDGGCVSKRELQLFLKRVRKELGETKIKYFACGEYGEKFGRPHYHLIIFGIGVGDKKIIEKCWRYGFIKVEGVNRKTCKYVAKYVTKAILGRSRRESKHLGEAAPFQIQSRGIGMRWIVENIEDVGARGIHYHGREQAVPRYYINKGRQLGMSDQSLEDLRAKNMQRRFEETLKLVNQGLSGAEIAERHEGLRLQRIEELKTKDAMYRNNDDL